MIGLQKVLNYPFSPKTPPVRPRWYEIRIQKSDPLIYPIDNYLKSKILSKISFGIEWSNTFNPWAMTLHNESSLSIKSCLRKQRGLGFHVLSTGYIKRIRGVVSLLKHFFFNFPTFFYIIGLSADTFSYLHSLWKNFNLK